MFVNAVSAEIDRSAELSPQTHSLHSGNFPRGIESRLLCVALSRDGGARQDGRRGEKKPKCPSDGEQKAIRPRMTSL